MDAIVHAVRAQVTRPYTNSVHVDVVRVHVVRGASLSRICPQTRNVEGNVVRSYVFQMTNSVNVQLV